MIDGGLHVRLKQFDRISPESSDGGCSRDDAGNKWCSSPLPHLQSGFQRCGPAIASGYRAPYLLAGAGHALEWRPSKVAPTIETLGNFAEGARKMVWKKRRAAAADAGC